MAIRLEFYAEDQVVATGVVEYAISRGVMLQAYTEIGAPLKREPKATETAQEKTKPGPKPGFKRKRSKIKRVSNMNRVVKCVNPDLPFAKGSKFYSCAQIIVGFSEPTPVKEIYNAVKAAGLNMSNAYPAMRQLMDIGHVIEV